jgi:hypothetical protein
MTEIEFKSWTETYQNSKSHSPNIHRQGMIPYRMPNLYHHHHQCMNQHHHIVLSTLQRRLGTQLLMLMGRLAHKLSRIHQDILHLGLALERELETEKELVLAQVLESEQESRLYHWLHNLHIHHLGENQPNSSTNIRCFHARM